MYVYIKYRVSLYSNSTAMVCDEGRIVVTKYKTGLLYYNKQ